jgi:hypothetical protein
VSGSFFPRLPRLDLTDDKNTAARRFLDEGDQHFSIFFLGEVSVATPAAAVRPAHAIARNETIAQLADPSRCQPQGPGRLFQAQSLAQRQDHGLRLSILLQAFRLRQNLQRFSYRFFPFEWP